MKLRLCRAPATVPGVARGQDSALCQQLVKPRAERKPVTTPPANNRGQSVPPARVTDPQHPHRAMSAMREDAWKPLFMPARFPLWPITVILDYVLVIQESGSKRRMLSCAAGAPPVTVSGAVPVGVPSGSAA